MGNRQQSIRTAGYGRAIPKYEMRNPKQIQSTKRTRLETLPPGGSAVWDFGSCTFELASSFEIRISSFPPCGRVIIRAKQSQSKPIWAVGAAAISNLRFQISDWAGTVAGPYRRGGGSGGNGL